MNKRLLFIISMIIALTGATFAQSGKIMGKVIDKNTGEPLPGCNIII